MPPWSLHHLMRALTASDISCPRPAACGKPASSPNPMWISSAVMPVSDAVFVPLGSPPHGDARSPNAWLPDGFDVVVPPPSSSLREEPHATATRATNASTAARRTSRPPMRHPLCVDHTQYPGPAVHGHTCGFLPSSAGRR